ncbi:ferritin-like domain-containing protein [Persicobacter psychrovividus]|uniref:Ferritin/DPS domain-containing protein n=1 Tax=Persicobacter psychrovividus TaxID=387638 RepID=A0ABN6L9D7_9BACT|nr:hypothetical protein PEPS_02090 [Persicobacter psychrovividus]
MLTETTVNALHQRISDEANARSICMAYQNWCEKNGYPNTKLFCQQLANDHWANHNDLVEYLQECGHHSHTPNVNPQPEDIKNFHHLMDLLVIMSQKHLQALNDTVQTCWQQNDYDTMPFLNTRISKEISRHKRLSTWKKQLRGLPQSGEGILIFDQSIK